MVAALLRVIYGGVQDSRLLPFKGQPSIEHFVKVFVRAGRFTTQWVRIDFDTRPLFGQIASLTLPPKGHLVSRVYLVSEMPDIAAPQAAAKAWCEANGKTFVGPTFGWTNSLGHAVVAQAGIEIGGSRVEQIDGRLLEVLDEFYTPLEKVELVNRLLQRDTTAFAPGRFGGDTVTRTVTPLPFWFSQGDAGTFLPIDALYVDSVRVRLGFAALNTLFVSSAQRKLQGGSTQPGTAEAAAAAGSGSGQAYADAINSCAPTVETPTVSAGPGATTYAVPGGEAYFPLGDAVFYYDDPAGTPIPGLDGNPDQTRRVSQIPSIKMPSAKDLVLGDTYLMVEYIYLDAPEANRFRLADIQVPVTQHYAFDPVDTRGTARATCYLKIPNPTRNLFFYLQRAECTAFNAPFLATRDLSGSDAPIAPWWPNATRIHPQIAQELVPAYAFRRSEPIKALSFIYEGKLFRYSSVAPSFFRSLLPSYEQRKSPWANRYYYNLPFCLHSGYYPPSLPVGEANLDKIVNINLQLDLHPYAGYADPNAVPRMLVYSWAETYNVFRVYGGRGGMMFNY